MTARVVPPPPCRTNPRNVDAILHVIDQQLALHFIGKIHVQHERHIARLDRHVLAITIGRLIRCVQIATSPREIHLKPKFLKIRFVGRPVRDGRESRGWKFLQLGKIE